MDITELEFNKFSSYVRQNFGINLSEKKISLITNRLESLFATNNYKSFSEYYEYVIADKSGKAVNELLNRITTNHTFFYREQKHYDFLENEILPYINEKEQISRDLRIWSAGCSSGEEPYALAMLIKEFFNNNHSLWNTQILATDISTEVLLKAQKGVYANSSAEQVPTNWRQKYFKSIDLDTLEVDEKIRKEVLFKKFNLMNNFPFRKKFHVVFCRNVMIYFDNETKRDLINKFYNSLETGGYLIIGHSESIDRNHTDLQYVQPSIYRKV